MSIFESMPAAPPPPERVCGKCGGGYPPGMMRCPNCDKYFCGSCQRDSGCPVCKTDLIGDAESYAWVEFLRASEAL